MSKSGCVSHKSRQQLIIIREDYLAICDQNHCAAAILNIFEYWTDSKLDNREQAETENAIAAAGNAPPVADDLWIYKSIPDLQKELLGLFGESKISAALDLLKEKKLLDSRNNPKYGWDRTLQYQFNITLTQALISRHVPSRKSKASKPSKSRHGSRENTAAIPKNTPKKTTEISPIHTEWLQFSTIGNALIKVFKNDFVPIENQTAAALEPYLDTARDLTRANAPVEHIQPLHKFVEEKATREGWSSFSVRTLSKYYTEFLKSLTAKSSTSRKPAPITDFSEPTEAEKQALAEAVRTTRPEWEKETAS